MEDKILNLDSGGNNISYSQTTIAYNYTQSSDVICGNANFTFSDGVTCLPELPENVTDAGAASAMESPCETFRLISYFGMMGTFCILGLAGNSLSIFVLQKDRNNKVASFLLQSLAVADNTVLTLSFFVLSIAYGLLESVISVDTTSSIVAYAVKYLQPLGYMSHTATIWCTVLLAMNRYVAICTPFRAPQFCTINKARVQVAAVFSFAIIFNFPRFFQKSIRVSNKNLTYAADTYIGETSTFGIIYTNILYSILAVLLPLSFLVFLNIKLIREVHKMRRRRSVSSQPQFREENITTVMIIVIIIVIVCHLPDRILHIAQYLITYENRGCGTVAYYSYFATNMLIVLNSSTNFLIYYFCRRRFRRILKEKMFNCMNTTNKHYRISSSGVEGHSEANNGALLTMDTRLNKKISNGNLLAVDPPNR